MKKRHIITIFIFAFSFFVTRIAFAQEVDEATKSKSVVSVATPQTTESSTTKASQITPVTKTPTKKAAVSIKEEKEKIIEKEAEKAKKDSTKDVQPTQKPDQKTVVHKQEAGPDIVITSAAPEKKEYTPPVELDTDTPHMSLSKWLKPWEYIEGEKLIEINFENAQLINLIKYFEKEYGLTFILDNVLEPLPPGGKSPTAIRFSFKTEQPFNKKEAWDIFVAFLDMAGLMVIPGPAERVFQITNNQVTSKLSGKEPLPTFIGIETSLLPSSDVKIRYVYFVQNTTPQVIVGVAESLRSAISSPPIVVGPLNALILTDKASNIRATLAVLKELDQARLPETLSVIKLKQAEATKVKALYDQLATEERSLLQRFSRAGQPQAASSSFLTKNVRVIADQRTNRLIILGPQDSVKKIEEFISNEIDQDIDLPYSPLHVYPLHFIDAETTAAILNDLRKSFEQQGGTAAVGGVVAGIKFLKPTVTITPEKSTNSLIINAEYDDYLQIYDLLQKIDTEQPQVATHILVLDVDVTDDRAFGIQFRNRVPTLNGLLGDNVNFQTSGLPFSTTSFAPIVENPATVTSPKFPPTIDQGGSVRLLGDLINLASANIFGSTVLTLGSDAFGVWGIFKVLQSLTNVSVVAKPFLVTTHKYNAQIAINEVRRVVTSNVIGGGENSQPTLGDLTAGLTVNLTPQISPDGLITLNVTVENSNFTTANSAAISSTGALNTDSGNRNEKKITTSVIIENNQVLALGGLVIDRILDTEFKTPILGDIPLVGWFFRNKAKTQQKTSLLILISSQIIQPHTERKIDEFTDARIRDAERILCEMDSETQLRDPIQTYFFGNDTPELTRKVREFAQPVTVDMNGEMTADKKQEKPQKHRRRRRRKRKPSPEKPTYQVDISVSDETGRPVNNYTAPPAETPRPKRQIPPPKPVSKKRRRQDSKSLHEFMHDPANTGATQ